MVATLTAPIATSFASLSGLSWVASTYLIANAASQSLSGRLTDIFGRRAGLLASNLAFGVGTLICGIAPNMSVLILGRAIAGLGGGALLAITTIFASDLVPLRKRGVIQGFNNIVIGIGTGSGGFLGGLINNVWGWRWAFLIQVPLIAMATLLVFVGINFEVQSGKESALHRIDFRGAFTLVATLVLLLLGLNSGGNVLPWTHPFVLTTIALSLPSFVAFIYIEDRLALEPIIPVRLLLNRSVASVCAGYFFTNMAAFAVLYYIPIYLQVLGESTTEAGLRLVPQSVGTAVASLVSGFVIRATGRYYHLNVLIQATAIAGYTLLCTLTAHSAPWRPFVYLALVGLGYGGALVVSLLALISAVDQEYQATITSASFAFRSVGSTLGMTAASVVFQNILRRSLCERLGDSSDAQHLIRRVKNRLDELQHLPPLAKQMVVDSYMLALHDVFLLTLACIVMAGLVSLFIRDRKLQKSFGRS